MKITELLIHTSNLSKQIDFYKNTIGLTVLNKNSNTASFKIGNSVLKLNQSNSFQPYHFAINIPCNKVQESLQWLKTKVDVLKDGSKEIVNFDGWNAKAVYFYDADNNIVELIARNNLCNESKQVFSTDLFLEISEIGVPVNNLKKVYQSLHKQFNLTMYDGDLERFCAVGNEEGLFICIDKNVKKWFPVQEKAYSSAFKIKFKEQETEHKMEFVNG